MIPTTKREALIAEVLGDTGKILDDCENLSKLIPKITSEYTSEMSVLFEKWKKEAEKEQNKILNQNIQIHKKEIQEAIENILYREGLKFFEKINKQIDDFFYDKKAYMNYLYIVIAFLLFIIGIIVGKFIL